MRVIATQNDTVDLLCWRYYGKTAGVTEAVYAANPGLCEIGPLLPAGTVVTLPDDTTPQFAETVQLWD
ncbi:MULTISPECIES: tail protein X [Dickeya]|uniref:Tail component protein n=1 Tax=Dickeya aquatica TaxID=1401087 RepID=A0A375AA16_9GAMM|nr:MULTISPECIES: tail protein X [Dickeya]SLM62827.1 Tail component protein [Dickeya aquatica]